MRQTKKPNTILDAALAFAVGILFMLVGLYITASLIAFLWNFVMPVLGLPVITPLHALALFFLAKIFKMEYKSRKPVVLNANFAPVTKESNNESSPRNKYPV